jgi:hypothetical protein
MDWQAGEGVFFKVYGAAQKTAASRQQVRATPAFSMMTNL